MLQTKFNELDDFLKSIQLSKNDVLSHLLEEKGFTLEDLSAVKEAQALLELPWAKLNADEALETLLKEKGLTLEDLKSLKTSKKSEKEESKSCVEKESVKSSQLSNWRDYPIVNSKFNEDDIRSKVQIGWYAFAGGHFSSDKNAYPNCQGVIGIINDDPTAKEGNRVKVVLRHQEKLEWCEEYIYTGVTDDDNGRENTRRLLEFGKAHGIKFPAMEFAQNYAFDGVKPGEAYVPARNELLELSKNLKAIDDALEQIGSSFRNFYWSSSENSNNNAWFVSFGLRIVYYNNKNYSYAVSCLLDY